MRKFNITYYTSRSFAFLLLLALSTSSLHAQTNDYFNAYQKALEARHNLYQSNIEKNYSNYLRGIWEKFKAYNPIPIPEDNVQPVVYEKGNDIEQIPIEEKNIIEIEEKEQKNPTVIPEQRESPTTSRLMEISFFDTRLRIHRPSELPILKNLSGNSLGETWDDFGNGLLANTFSDCVEYRSALRLCDWSYINLLHEVATALYPNDKNTAMMCYAFMLDLSGFDMRIGRSNQQLIVLLSCDHIVYKYNYFVIGDENFYPFFGTKDLGEIEICSAGKPNRQSVSLLINKEQSFSEYPTHKRTIKSTYGEPIEITVPVSQAILDFYASYPASTIGGNSMTRWSIYAQTPIEKSTRESLYGQLQQHILGKSQVTAANILLNFVQTGFAYKYDEEVWGEDRAFFAEESLHYPYCDCEDRSILFSHLIRDLLNLDVALVYTPGHLFTVVNFTEPTNGAYMIINGKKFTVCEPTCTNGAPVGWSGSKTDDPENKLIVLRKIQYE